MLNEGRVGIADVPPARPILIYDGDCGFCRRWVARVQRWDRARAVDYLPLQDGTAPLVAGRAPEALRQAVHLVRVDGVVFAGAAAARELFGLLPFGGIIHAVMGLPGVMAGAARCYAWVARRWGPVS